ncbi:hypothetical protein [Christensenella intestinihominis]|uniref:hypothetical protein n=1 Tax=Christensenella intestinihominis TaxID=1851429 RepID=UPI00082EA389|nr:hypothetical protein [Christensenella intestinihominis]
MAKNIRFKWNQPVPRIIDDVGINAKTAKYAAQDWYRLYYAFIPYREGYLAKNIQILALPNKAVIRHNEPYAEKIYHGAHMRFGKSTHRLASAYWDRVAMTAGKKDKLISDVQAFVKRRV